MYLLFLCFVFVVSENYFLDLTKEKWDVTNRNGSIHLENVKIPGVIHTHLIEAKIIGDPYYRFNDNFQRWVGKDDWTYRIQDFNIDKKYSRMELVCDGLDTVVEISLNGELVANVDNMFHQFRFDVTKSLKVGSNSLSFKFLSPINEAKRRHDLYPYEVPASDATATYSGEPYRNFLRKEQCSFAWDWGPCFTPSGVYKDIYLVGYNDLTLEYFAPNVDCKYKKDATSCSITVDIAATAMSTISNVKVNVAIQELGVSKDFEISVGPQVGISRVTIDNISVKDENLWWPNGFGNAKLFDLVFKFNGGSVVDSKKIGFREVRVITKPISSEEESFYFEVNGLDIFAKGANFIPMDSFEDRISKEDISDLIQTAADSNMNMIRVWGGGLYQRDDFYDLCDVFGLLVWQEFMFACALYPTDSKYLASVTEEVSYQVNRLKHHPSIALWSGSNENEASLWDKTWYVGTVTPENKIMYGIDYAKLYFDTVRKVVVENDPVRFFWISSPTNGIISEDPYQGRWTNPYSFDKGDVHYYNYVEKCTDVSNFPKGKFISEYGWQSYPSFTTLSHVILPEDYSIQGELMMHRQHHPMGVEQILSQMGRFFKPTDLKGENKFKSNLYLSQLLQSFCIKAETEYYRTLMESDYTMGALYWQMNSIWQAPTWSSLEYGGKWKILHYEVKKFFAPLLVTSYENNGNFYVYLVSDVLEDIVVTVTLKSLKWSRGGQIGHAEGSSWNMKYLQVRELVNMPTSQFLKNFNCSSASDCYLELSAIYKDKEGKDVKNDNYHLFSPLSDVNLMKPKIEYKLTLNKEKTEVEVDLTAENLAPFVFLDVDMNGRFDENAFFLYPKENKTVTFTAPAGKTIDLDLFQKSFSTISVRDTYSFDL